MVSIIVLTYKNFQNLKNNIRSIAEQKYDDYEVIIQDDGSPNFNFAFVESLVKQSGKPDKFHIERNEKNLGTVKNMNKAIKKTHGDIIVPLSQDDIFFDSDTLSLIVEAFNKGDKNVFQGKRIGEKSKLIRPNKEEEFYFTDKASKDCKWFRMAMSSYLSGASLYWKKETLEEVGFFDENYVLLEDYPVMLKLIEKDISVGLINSITVKYGEDGISSNHASVEMINDCIRMYTTINENAETILSSVFCKKMLKHQLNEWLSIAGEKERFDIKLIDIYFFLLYTKILSILTGIDINTLRFRTLWASEIKSRKNAG